MTITYGFYNAVAGDRKYNAEQFASLFEGIINDGIFMSIGDHFAVNIVTGMTISVGSGRAWFNNTWTDNDFLLYLDLEVGEVILDRIDAIVIEVDKTDTARVNTIKVVKGTPSVTPAAPAMVSTDYIHQYPLCYIEVGAGVTTLIQYMITNRIGSSECPYITSILETTDIDNVVAQWESEFNTWFANLDTMLSGEVAANLQSQINALDIAKPDIDEAQLIKYGDDYFSPRLDLANGFFLLSPLSVGSRVIAVTDLYYVCVNSSSVISVYDRATNSLVHSLSFSLSGDNIWPTETEGNIVFTRKMLSNQVHRIYAYNYIENLGYNFYPSLPSYVAGQRNGYLYLVKKTADYTYVVEGIVISTMTKDAGKDYTWTARKSGTSSYGNFFADDGYLYYVYYYDGSIRLDILNCETQAESTVIFDLGVGTPATSIPATPLIWVDHTNTELYARYNADKVGKFNWTSGAGTELIFEDASLNRIQPYRYICHISATEAIVVYDSGVRNELALVNVSTGAVTKKGTIFMGTPWTEYGADLTSFRVSNQFNRSFVVQKTGDIHGCQYAYDMDLNYVLLYSTTALVTPEALSAIWELPNGEYLVINDILPYVVTGDTRFLITEKVEDELLHRFGLVRATIT